MNNPLNSLTALYKFQDQILTVCRFLDTGFYLTGGTAAARGYLSHRFSADLEFKVNDSTRFGLWVEQALERLRKEVQWKIQLISQEERFSGIFLSHNDLRIKVNFYNDGPLHMGVFSSHPVLGRLDSPENILANKLLALISRPEPNDLADIWGLCTIKGASIETAITHPSSKAAGLFVPDLARLLCTVTKDDWKMVQWIQPPPLDVYLTQLNSLGESLLLPKSASPSKSSGANSANNAAQASALPESPIRQIRGPGLLNYSAAIKAAAQNSIASTPRRRLRRPPPVLRPGTCRRHLQRHAILLRLILKSPQCWKAGQPQSCGCVPGEKSPIICRFTRHPARLFWGIWLISARLAFGSIVKTQSRLSRNLNCASIYLLRWGVNPL